MIEALQTTVAVLFILVGLTFMLLGSVGILRLPDFFTRTHAAAKVDTLGLIVLLLGLAIYEGFTLNAAKLLIGVIFILLANSVMIHALARAALQSGEPVWYGNNRTAEQTRSRKGGDE